MNEIVGTGYLYSLWSGRLRVYYGKVYKSTRNKDLGRLDAITSSFFCSITPGVVYNSVVWLEEKDDKKAINILIDYQKTQIYKLKEKVNTHLHNIKILEEVFE